MSGTETAVAHQDLMRLYEQMLLIRRTEERLRDENKAGNLPGAVHLYIGEEAIATGVCANLRESDMITSTHRGHGHYLAKGGDPECHAGGDLGEEHGHLQGHGRLDARGGFLQGHSRRQRHRGRGFRHRHRRCVFGDARREGKIVVDFFGDGSSNQGTLMECLNIAALWQLPLVFVCENNTFSEFSPAKTVTAGVIADRARAFGIPTEVVDGNDVTAVAKAAKTAVERARSGGGPSFIEAHTYRIQGHLEAEDLFLGGQRYREPEEIESWKKKGPDRGHAQAA